MLCVQHFPLTAGRITCFGVGHYGVFNGSLPLGDRAAHFRFCAVDRPASAPRIGVRRSALPAAVSLLCRSSTAQFSPVAPLMWHDASDLDSGTPCAACAAARRSSEPQTIEITFDEFGLCGARAPASSRRHIRCIRQRSRSHSHPFRRAAAPEGAASAPLALDDRRAARTVASGAVADDDGAVGTDVPHRIRPSALTRSTVWTGADAEGGLLCVAGRAHR